MLKRLLTGASLVLLPASAQASAITWDAGGSPDKNWGTDANWSSDSTVTTGDEITFTPTGAAASGTTTSIMNVLDTGSSTTFTITSLGVNYGTNTTSNWQTISNNSNTLAITGAAGLQVGTTSSGASSAISKLAVTTGTLSLGTVGTSAELSVAFTRAGSSTAERQANRGGYANLSELTSFTGVLSALRVGVYEAGDPSNTSRNILGALVLAPSNTITTDVIRVAESTFEAGNLERPRSSASLVFGNGTNTVNPATTGNGVFVVGGRASANINADPISSATGGKVTVNSSGTVNIGSSGTRFGAVRVGWDQSAGNSNQTLGNIANGSFDMTGGTINAYLTELTLGAKTKTGNGNLAGGAIGTFTMEAGLVDVNVITLGNRNDTSTSTVSGTLNLNGGTLRFGTLTEGTGGAASAYAGLLNLGSPSLTSATLASQDGTARTIQGNLDIDLLGDITLGQGSGGTGALTFAAGATNGGSAVGVIRLNSSPSLTTLVDTTFDNGIDETGGSRNLTKKGAATLYLNSTNSYTGTTTVEGGTLAGTGSLLGPVNVQVGGKIAPGTASSSIESLSVAGTLTLGGLTQMQIDKTPSLLSDVIDGIATLNYGGTLAVSDLDNDTSNYGVGDTFKLFDASTYAGVFTGYNLPTLSPSLTWDTSGLMTSGTITVVAVPEPALVGGLALLGLLGTRRAGRQRRTR